MFRNAYGTFSFNLMIDAFFLIKTGPKYQNNLIPQTCSCEQNTTLNMVSKMLSISPPNREVWPVMSEHSESNGSVYEIRTRDLLDENQVS